MLIASPKLTQRPLNASRRAARLAGVTVAMLLATLTIAYSAHAAEKSFTLTVKDTKVDIGGGMKYQAWTYDGTVPGPVLRVDQGDTVKIDLVNHTTDAHGIQINAAQISPSHFGGDPLKSVEYTFKAEVPGVFAYHCTAIPVLDHIAGGMYGMMIVNPKGGYPDGPAQEVTLVRSEVYGLPDAKGLVIGNHAKMVAAQPDFVVFNGMLNRYSVDHPIPIKVGHLVRVFFLNAGPSLSSTFNVRGVVLKTVYVGGNPANVLHGVSSFEVGPREGAVFEFRVDQPGNYPFADVGHADAYKGALGIFHATR